MRVNSTKTALAFTMKLRGSSLGAGYSDERFFQVQKDTTATSPLLSEFFTDLKRLKPFPPPRKSHEHGDNISLTNGKSYSYVD
jgi:hypothetical protein